MTVIHSVIEPSVQECKIFVHINLQNRDRSKNNIEDGSICVTILVQQNFIVILALLIEDIFVGSASLFIGLKRITKRVTEYSIDYELWSYKRIEEKFV